jgi:hypothetical protein
MSDEPEIARARARCTRFGFASLTFWASLGFLLEAAHAFKLSAYLDHPLRRELLLWAHAHGVGLNLVLLAYAALGLNARSVRYERPLRGAALLMPAAFALGIFGHGEADPGPSIWFVPIGALALLYALFGITRSLRA